MPKGQSRETGNIGYTRTRQTEQKHNTICWTLLCYILFKIIPCRLKPILFHITVNMTMCY